MARYFRVDALTADGRVYCSNPYAYLADARDYKIHFRHMLAMKTGREVLTCKVKYYKIVKGITSYYVEHEGRRSRSFSSLQNAWRALKSEPNIV